ncbi:WD repeat-containing 91 [Brachionus plicatilis]|uniref:WD repeat-containing 91 n=1 Tax=Brachionus plicatilis TaxID=10195 RepID=A0A3M7T5H3_BRAPC|nr:WD repeat-containing 91 [Brachionus plicatilis]
MNKFIYLNQKSFSSSLKTFEYDLKSDKEKSFRPEKITELLLSFIYQYDLANLLDLWTFLDQKYFTRISLKIGTAHAISRKYELFLLRYYLVHAAQTNKLDKVVEFFENYVSKLQCQNEWKEWFCLPFTKNPEDSAQFSIYFSKNWIDTFMVSLQNFLAIIFQSIQLPRLLNYDEDAFWSKCSLNQDVPTDYDSFSRDYLQTELNDEFEFKNQTVATKSSGGLIGLFKHLKNNKLSKSRDTKNLNAIANEIINDDSNVDNSYEKLVIKPEIVQEGDPSKAISQPYVTLNQEDLNEHKSAIVLIKISHDSKFLASVDSDEIIKGVGLNRFKAFN